MTLIISWGLCCAVFFSVGASSVTQDVQRMVSHFALFGALTMGIETVVRCPLDMIPMMAEDPSPSAIHRMVLYFMHNNYIRAALLIIFFPVIIVWLGLSYLRQLARQAEYILCGCGFVEKLGEETATKVYEAWELAAEGYFRELTPETGYIALALYKSMPWNIIAENVIILCVVYHLFMGGANVFLVVLLAMFRKAMAELAYGAAICLFAIVGLLLLMLPIVPGATVYVAAGAILVAPDAGDGWPSVAGSIVIACLIAWVLKIASVLLLYRLGSYFGSTSLRVKLLFHVHYPVMRCLEIVLNTPWDPAAIAILVSGPDWPIAFLTGVLRIDVKVLLRNLAPTILYIVPCVLMGAHSHWNEGPRQVYGVSLFVAATVVFTAGMMTFATASLARKLDSTRKELESIRAQDEELLLAEEQYLHDMFFYTEATRAAAWP